MQEEEAALALEVKLDLIELDKKAWGFVRDFLAKLNEIVGVMPKHADSFAQMEIALNLQEKEKEVERLKSQDEMTALQLKNTRMVITLIILAAVAGIAFINVYVSKRKVAR